MTVDEVYKKLVNHMLHGMMLHADFANYYDFLGLKGYKRCQEYHFLCETASYRSVSRYFINHHDKLVPEEEFHPVDVIPETWFAHERDDVDTATKRNAVKDGFEKWLEWETKTKELYTALYKELVNLNDISDANKIEGLICDVDQELKWIKRSILDLESVNYSIDYIISQQHWLHRKYKNKMKKIIRIDIC